MHSVCSTSHIPSEVHFLTYSIQRDWGNGFHCFCRINPQVKWSGGQLWSMRWSFLLPIHWFGTEFRNVWTQFWKCAGAQSSIKFKVICNLLQLSEQPLFSSLQGCNALHSFLFEKWAIHFTEVIVHSTLNLKLLMLYNQKVFCIPCTLCQLILLDVWNMAS